MRTGSMGYIPAGTPHRHRNDAAVEEVHLEVLAPGFSFRAANLTFLEAGAEWWAGGTVAHLPDPADWAGTGGGTRRFAFSDPSGTLAPAFPDSRNAMLVMERNEGSAGADQQVHVHRFDQLYFVTEGTLEIEIALDRHQVPTGSLVVVPAGVPHRAAPGGGGAEAHLMISSPSPADVDPGRDPWSGTPVTFGA
jgi:quercetin dioxygenase-like cupin family protein